MIFMFSWCMIRLNVWQIERLYDLRFFLSGCYLSNKIRRMHIFMIFDIMLLNMIGIQKITEIAGNKILANISEWILLCFQVFRKTVNYRGKFWITYSLKANEMLWWNYSHISWVGIKMVTISRLLLISDNKRAVGND